MTRRFLPFSLVMAFATGCSHGEPFGDRAFGSDTTLTRGTNRQLTYNLATDRTPAWTPDGSGILYMSEDGVREDHDRCLAELPATGGTIRAYICPATLQSQDSVDALFEPAVGPNGSMLYVREVSLPELVTPLAAALVLASPEAPLEGTIVQSYPYPAANGKTHQGISHVRWLSATKAVYLAEKVDYIFSPGGGPADTVRTGLDLVLVDLSGSSPTTQIIPNTDDASSVSAGGNSDEVYLTKNGDSRVYKLTLSSGSQVVVHDFGAGEIARDVEVVGNQLYAILRGRVSFGVDPVLGPMQPDKGGQVRRVDLTNGNEELLVVSGRFFRRPSLSPRGGRMVAEAYQATITTFPGGFQDTTISTVSDLWYFEVP